MPGRDRYLDGLLERFERSGNKKLEPRSDPIGTEKAVAGKLKEDLVEIRVSADFRD
jgi:hypothetical protein